MLDTNIASFLIRNHPPEVRLHLQLIPLESVHISSVTEAELRYGIEKRAVSAALKTAVEDFLGMVRIAPWDSQAAKAYAQLKVQLESTGRSLGSYDMLIAAHAFSLDALLVTHDKAMLNIEGLRSQDWLKD